MKEEDLLHMLSSLNDGANTTLSINSPRPIVFNTSSIARPATFTKVYS